MVLSRLKLTPPQFYDLTPVEFYEALSDHELEIENNRRFELEKMRIQTFYLINIQLPISKRLKQPKELISFEWEQSENDKNKPEPQILTEQEWLELDEKVKKISAKARPI